MSHQGDDDQPAAGSRARDAASVSPALATDPAAPERPLAGVAHSDAAPDTRAGPTEASQTLRLGADDVRRYTQRVPQRRGALLVIGGTPADIGKHLVVEQSVTIGRTREGLELCDGNISRRHAVVARTQAGYVISDLGSTNGTLVNGARIEGPHALGDGDKIVVGNTLIKFDVIDDAEALYHQEVERLVSTDDLTGLVSKHRFDAHLQEAIRAARTVQVPLSAMMMDMDGLKAINDRHGHHVGAGTIGQVGMRIRGVLAGAGDACRFGGDEFCAFARGADLARAIQIAGEIRVAVEREPFQVKAVKVRATISIGVAALTPDVIDAPDLLRRADMALYRAKALGKNVVSG